MGVEPLSGDLLADTRPEARHGLDGHG